MSAKIYLWNITSFTLKNTNFLKSRLCFYINLNFFQFHFSFSWVSLLQYESLFSTISLNICQDIKFTDILLKYEILKKKNYIELSMCRLCSLINYIYFILYFIFRSCGRIILVLLWLCLCCVFFHCWVTFSLLSVVIVSLL